MKDLEKTKRFNIEDINIDPKEEQATNALEESMDELDEIIAEDQNSKDFEDDALDIELDDEIAVEQEAVSAKEESEPLDEEESDDEEDFEEEKEKIIDEFNKTHDLTGRIDLSEVDEEANEKIDPELESIVKNDYQEETIIDMNIPKGNTIGIASDHRGYKLKQKLTKYLTKLGYTVVDFGTDGSFSVDYPEFGFKLGEAVADFEVEKGIAICGSGIGISIACNKIKGVRCAKVDNVKEVKYARKDNDANVIAIAGNMPTFKAKDIVDAFLNTQFTNLDRHKRRIEMLDSRG